MSQNIVQLIVAQTKFSPFVIKILTVFMRIIITVTFKRLLIHLQVWCNLYMWNLSWLWYILWRITRLPTNRELVGYTFIRADHRSNTKWGATRLYYRNSLAFRVLNFQYLEECINFEISSVGKVFNFISLYWSPSQFHNIF